MDNFIIGLVFHHGFGILVNCWLLFYFIFFVDFCTEILTQHFIAPTSFVCKIFKNWNHLIGISFKYSKWVLKIHYKKRIIGFIVFVFCLSETNCLLIRNLHLEGWVFFCLLATVIQFWIAVECIAVHIMLVHPSSTCYSICFWKQCVNSGFVS